MRNVLAGAAAFTVAGLVPLVTAAAQPLKPGTVRVELTSGSKITQASNLMDSNNWGEAIALLTQVIDAEPNNALARANRAICYVSINRVVEAEQDLAIAEELEPETAINHRARALLADRRSDDHGVLSELAKSIKLEPGNSFSNLHLAWLLQSMNREGEALAAAKAFNIVRPDLPGSYLLVAQILSAQGQTKQAARMAPAILAALPNSRAASMVAAEIYDAVDDRPHAMEQIGKAIALDPATPFLYRRSADYRSPSDVAGRRTDLTQAISLEPNNLDTVVALAQLDFQEGHWADAKVGYSKILAAEPKDFGILTYRAMANERLAMTAEAERDLQAAIGASGGAGDYYQICRALAREGKLLDRVLAVCEMANTAHPDDADILAARGLAKLRLDRFDQALADYTRSLSVDDRKPESYYGRVLVRWRSGDHDGALQDLGRARTIEPLIDERFRIVGFDDLPS